MDAEQWVALTVGILAAGTMVVTALVPRWADARRHRRDEYAEAVAALVAWAELPYRIARRTSNSEETLAALADRIHDLQEKIACHSAWLAADSRFLGDFYGGVAHVVREAVRTSLRSAWAREPVREAAHMNVGSLGIDQIALRRIIVRLNRAVRYRFGFRRAMGWLWRWRLAAFREPPEPPIEPDENLTGESSISSAADPLQRSGMKADVQKGAESYRPRPHGSDRPPPPDASVRDG